MPSRARRTLTVVLLLIGLVVAGYALKYQSWPFVQPPNVVRWCGATWDRQNARLPTPARLYPATRQPPLIGTQLYSTYPPAERRRLSTGEDARPCGGRLMARDGDRVVPYVAPG
jgi:hypothetical protein